MTLHVDEMCCCMCCIGILANGLFVFVFVCLFVCDVEAAIWFVSRWRIAAASHVLDLASLLCGRPRLSSSEQRNRTMRMSSGAPAAAAARCLCVRGFHRPARRESDRIGSDRSRWHSSACADVLAGEVDEWTTAAQRNTSRLSTPLCLQLLSQTTHQSRHLKLL